MRLSPLDYHAAEPGRPRNTGMGLAADRIEDEVSPSPSGGLLTLGEDTSPVTPRQRGRSRWEAPLTQIERKRLTWDYRDSKSDSVAKRSRRVGGCVGRLAFSSPRKARQALMTTVAATPVAPVQ